MSAARRPQTRTPPRRPGPRPQWLSSSSFPIGTLIHCPDVDSRSGEFDINAIKTRFPATADTMLIDTRLTDEQEASCRVFRIYVDVPAHYHESCDEYLLVVSGRGLFRIAGGGGVEGEGGQVDFFKQATRSAR